MLYRIPGVYIYIRHREMVATFLYRQEDYLGREDKEKLVFSGRPEFGTTDLDLPNVLKVEPVDSGEKCCINKKVEGVY